MTTTLPQVSAIMLAWGNEPVLAEAVEAVLGSTAVEVDVVLVDNGCTDGAVDRLRDVPRVTVIEPGENTGFAGGCNLGAQNATGEILAFINGDAVVEPNALRRLVDALADDVGLASASLRLYDQPDVMNSAGNPIHFSGMSWAGGWGEPAANFDADCDIASATGAAVALRADRFADLGGFCEPMFAYCEDADLSLRSWQRGWRSVFVHDAVVRHRYEFTRNPQKWYLLERNRLFMVLTTLQVRTLLLLMPALLALEFAVLLTAIRQGWGRQKVAGWIWLLRNHRLIGRRRSDVQTHRTRSDRQIAPMITGDFTPNAATGMSVGEFPRRCSRLYWAAVRPLLSA